MTEKIILGSILFCFILAFAVRNIRTHLSEKQSIRGKSLKLKLSMFVSSLIYIILLLRLTLLQPKWILELTDFTSKTTKYTGFTLIFMGFIIGILALITMRNSWRMGIKYDQKTELITSGIYRFSRNPYFLSYDILFLGYLLIFPSVILLVLWVLLMVLFHKMILEEESYLQHLHGKTYTDYKKMVNRYITIR